MPHAAQRHRKRLAAATTTSVAIALITAGIAVANPASADQTTTLAGTSPSYATASADLGQTSAGTTVTARVYLAGRDAAGEDAYAQGVSDPSSSLYKHFLTPQQVKDRFGPSADQISAVTKWLNGSGLTVTSTTQHWMDVSGTAAAVQKAFATPLHNYKTDSGTLRAPQHDAKVPASVAGAVLGVSGLSQATSHAKTNSVKVNGASGDGATPNAAAASDPNCSSYYGEKLPQAGLPALPAGYQNPTYLAPCSYVPSQLRQAYGVTQTGLTGKGSKIAIVLWYGSTTAQSDENTFSTNHGDKPFKPGQYTEVETPANWTHQDLCGDPSSEQALDIAMAHGLAPDANVVYVGANSCFDDDLIAAEAKVVDEHLADVVSNSWGEAMFTTNGDITQASMDAYNQIFKQGAIEGIAFDFSSGDCMNNDAYSVSTGLNCDPSVSRAQVDWPTSSQWVTSVGGTALALDKKGKYLFEAPMGDDRSGRTVPGSAGWLLQQGTFGAGGGRSELTPQPWYQKWTVPSKLARTPMDGSAPGLPMRTIPDISLEGDLYFGSTLVGQTTGGVYSEAGFGGTSVSAPAWAGILADAQQAQWGIPVGFANPAIYFRSGLTNDVVAHPAAAGKGSVLSTMFQANYPDGTVKNRLIKYGVVEGLPASHGYDLATGVGSPNALFLRSFGWGR